jgi:hypothetical protein
MAKGALRLITQPNRRVRHEFERCIADEHVKQCVIGGRKGTAQACLPRFGRLAPGQMLGLFDEIAVQAHCRGSMQRTNVDIGK